jgi:hypothetical protein
LEDRTPTGDQAGIAPPLSIDSRVSTCAIAKATEWHNGRVTLVAHEIKFKRLLSWP